MAIDRTPLGKSSTPASASSADTQRIESVPRAIAQVVVRHWKAFAAVAGAVTVLGMAALLIIPRRYTSSTSFVVEAAPAAGMSSAMAIISQLNPNLAGGDSPKFYVDLVQSRPVLSQLLTLTPAAQCGAATRRTVLDMIDPGGDTDAARLRNGIDELRARVSSTYDLRTGVISVSIAAECPELARELADTLVSSINTFNVERRQTRAKLRREFSEQRAREAELALSAAEDELTSFQNANRVIVTPRLELESERLRRRVTEREEMANTLRRDANSARLDEINSIPALTIIEPPDTPIRASYPKRRLWGLAILLVAAITGACAALWQFSRRPLPEEAGRDATLLYSLLAHLHVRRARRIRASAA